MANCYTLVQPILYTSLCIPQRVLHIALSHLWSALGWVCNGPDTLILILTVATIRWLALMWCLCAAARVCVVPLDKTNTFSGQSVAFQSSPAPGLLIKAHSGVRHTACDWWNQQREAFIEADKRWVERGKHRKRDRERLREREGEKWAACGTAVNLQKSGFGIEERGASLWCYLTRRYCHGMLHVTSTHRSAQVATSAHT